MSATLTVALWDRYSGWRCITPIILTVTTRWSTKSRRSIRQFRREYIQFPPFGPEHLVNSLRHLAELVAPTSQA